jgi:hypothetical protein
MHYTDVILQKIKVCEKGTMNQEIRILRTMKRRQKTTTLNTGSSEKHSVVSE